MGKPPTLLLDVTQAASAPKHTGVERIERALWRVLGARRTVIPIVWDNVLRQYTRPDAPELLRLENPFRMEVPSRPDKPEGSGLSWLVKKATAPWKRRSRRISVEELSFSGGVSLLAEPFPDHRAPFWEKRLQLRKWAICHDVIPWEEAGGESGLLPRYDAYLAALATCKGVICISKHTETLLHKAWDEAGLKAVPTMVLPWPVDFPGSRPLPVPPREGEPRILCVGSLTRRKNHQVLLEACTGLWDKGLKFTLVIVGRTGKDGGAAAVTIRAALAQNRSIEWLQSVDEVRLQSEYQKCTFTVFPSLREGFGLPVMESLWHGRACLCSGEGAVGEVGRGGGCHFARVESVSDLAGALRELIENPVLRANLEKEAQARTFDGWDAYADRLLAAID